MSVSDTESYTKSVKKTVYSKEFVRKKEELDNYNSKGDNSDLETRVIMSDLDVKCKSDILKKIRGIGIMESAKYTSWVSSLLRIPFGKYSKNIVKKNQDTKLFLKKSMDILDSIVYKQDEAKKSIMDYCCRLISNKKCRGSIIALQSTPGTGKTKLIRQGLSKILNRPFYSINFGGLTDTVALLGHDYTYSGSSYGRLAQIIMDAEVMDPIIYLDEIDKIGGAKSTEIFGVLTHLLDEEQNSHFTDNYFQGVPLDFSRVLFVISYNDEASVNHVVSDRFKTIKLRDLSRLDKIYALDKYILDGILSEIKITRAEISFSDDAFEFIIDINKSASGMRQIKKMAQNIIERVNYSYFLGDMTFPVIITKNIICELIEFGEEQDKGFMGMYS